VGIDDDQMIKILFGEAEGGHEEGGEDVAVLLIPEDAFEDIIEDGRVESFFHKSSFNRGVPPMGAFTLLMGLA
jgi:hypothetical protein